MGLQYEQYPSIGQWFYLMQHEKYHNRYPPDNFGDENRKTNINGQDIKNSPLTYTFSESLSPGLHVHTHYIYN